MPEESDLLHMYVKGKLIKGALDINILVDTSPYPCVLFLGI
jgi:hypothetical protein